MSTGMLICSRCQKMVPRGVDYCPNCGEAVNPAIVAELQWRYAALLDLDQRIAAGESTKSLADLRREYRDRYLFLRTAPQTAPAAETPPVAPNHATLPTWLDNQPTAVSQLGNVPESVITVSQPAGPAFSWSAFIADQAIAIMAYLGGFLLLVATLSFEISNWNNLSNGFKMLVVGIVYSFFGMLGLGLRKSERLQTVGGAYLGVFALMTPLMALAVYRFELQNLGIPIAGMICLSAFYAAAIYLLLAWQTRFATYGYLGWTSLIVAALAVLPWAHAPQEWWVAALAVVALLGSAVRRIPLPVAMREPGNVAGIAATVCAGFGALGLTTLLLFNTFASFPTFFDRTALAVGTVLVTLSLLGWTMNAPRVTEPEHFAWRDRLIWLTAFTGAQSAISIAYAAHADGPALCYLLGILAILAFALAVGAQRLAESHTTLRLGLEGLALGLAGIGTLGALHLPDPNWPLVVALGAAGLVALGIAICERLPGWVVPAGAFISVAYRTLIAGLLIQYAGTHPDINTALLTFTAGMAALTLGIWLVAIILGEQPTLRQYAAAAFLVSFGDAVYVTVVMRSQALFPYQQTAVLAIFTLAALGAGYRQRQPVLGNFAAGIFGVVAVMPLIQGNNQGIVVALIPLVATFVALAVRWIMGRIWTAALVVVALWATLLATGQLIYSSESTSALNFLGIPFAAWLLIAEAALFTLLALWEGGPWTMICPALVALGAVMLAGDHTATAGLAFAVVGIGAGLRQFRGRIWNIPWLSVAVPASVIAVYRLGDLGTLAPHWQMALLFGFALVAYLIAWQEGAPWLTLAATVYGVAALAYVPPPATFVPTLVITFAAAALGGIIRLRSNLPWAGALYALASAGSLFAVSRLTPYSGGHTETLLLVFAATAYVLATLETNPWSATVPTLYVLGAIIVQPDAHALLPLALLFALLGIVAGRLGGPRWYLPPYLAAAVAGCATAFLGRGDTGFEPLALVALTLVVYVIAAIESRPEVVLAAFVLGGLALASAANWFGWQGWQSIIAFAALAWVFALLAYVWQALPWLQTLTSGWWESADDPASPVAQFRDTRLLGGWLHRWAGIVVALGTVAASWYASASFTQHSATTQAAAIGMLSLAGMLAWFAAVDQTLTLDNRPATSRILWYVAGEFIALALTWEARWLGAANIQALVLAPGSYQLVIGALLPVDERLGRPVTLGRLASIAGALLLLLPTLAQSFTGDPNWLYALVLAVEAIVIVGVGLGTRSRLLILIGSAFVGLAAIRGAILAFNSGLHWELVLVVLAALLLSGATWLSLRARHVTKS